MLGFCPNDSLKDSAMINNIETSGFIKIKVFLYHNITAKTVAEYGVNSCHLESQV
ncbi:hypothetical protein RP20_CCG015597 [Aedes albopictus]|nr:hypothetical protein RP20_CCG015597 [Aedes albopictus]